LIHRALDEVHAVVGVLLDARRDREDVGVEDDVLGREADLVDQDPVGPLADRLAALEVVGLPVLVEGHHDDRGAVLAAQGRLAAELLLALLHGDRVDDRLALHAAQPGLDDLELGGVDHQRDPADVGLGGDQLDEAVHRRDAVDHPLVHVDVDDLRAALDLLAGHRQRGAVVAVADQVAELRRPGDVGPLADVHEQRLGQDRERLEAGQPAGRDDRGHLPGRVTGDGLGHPADVLRRRAAATAEEVDQAALGELVDGGSGVLRRLVVLAERVGQAGVRVGGDERVRDPGQLREVRPHLVGAEGAVEPHQQGLGVPHGVPERLGHLAREGPPGGVGDGAADHDRPTAAALLEERLDGEDRGLGVEGVEDRLDEQQVGAAVHEAVGLLEVGLHEGLVGHVARTRVVDVRGDRRRAGRGAEGAGDVARLVGRLGGHQVALGSGQPSGLVVQLVGQLDHVVVGERDPLGVERVGLDQVGAGLEVLPVDGADDLGLAEREQVVVALQVAGRVGEPLPAVLGLAEAVPLDHRAHRAVEHQHPRAQQLGQDRRRVRTQMGCRHEEPPADGGALGRPAGRAWRAGARRSASRPFIRLPAG
jgi:hypothetical protein